LFRSLDQTKKSGLAASVGPHEPGFLSRIDLKAEIGKQNLPAVLFDHIRKNNHASSSQESARLGRAYRIQPYILQGREPKAQEHYSEIVTHPIEGLSIRPPDQ
jgi:hypothetical protein